MTFIQVGHLTALSLNAETSTNNRTFQAVEPEKLTRKFLNKNNSCAHLKKNSKMIEGMPKYFFLVISINFFFVFFFENFVNWFD